jgi:hypothetical protein
MELIDAYLEKIQKNPDRDSSNYVIFKNKYISIKAILKWVQIQRDFMHEIPNSYNLITSYEATLLFSFQSQEDFDTFFHYLYPGIFEIETSTFIGTGIAKSIELETIISEINERPYLELKMLLNSVHKKREII